MGSNALTAIEREIIADLRRVAESLRLKPGYSLTYAEYRRGNGLFRLDVIRAAGGWLELTAAAGYPSRRGHARRPRHQWQKTRLSVSQRELDAALDAAAGHEPAPRGLPRIMGHKHFKAPGIASPYEEGANDAMTSSDPSADAQSDADADLVRRLDAAMDFIGRRYRDGIQLADVARTASLSPFHFHKVFHRHFGRTPKQVITELQIAEAQRLMAAGTPLKEIAPLTGFAHQSHFIQRFKMITLTMPGRWVRGHRGRPALPPPDSMPEAA